MKIYTKQGDRGTTGLYGGPRVPKDDPWRRVASLDQVSAVFESYHRETGLWPCAWGGGASSVAPLSEYQCLRSRGFSGKIVDRWGSLIRVIYQSPSDELELAAHGVVSLVSTGPDGERQTPPQT